MPFSLGKGEEEAKEEGATCAATLVAPRSVASHPPPPLFFSLLLQTRGSRFGVWGERVQQQLFIRGVAGRRFPFALYSSSFAGL